MAKRTYYSSKKLRVEVQDAGLDRVMARFREGGVEAANQQTQDEVQNTVDFGYTQWGVRTGRGRESLRVGHARRGFKWSVRAFSQYKPLKYQSWNGKRPTFWQVLIQNPIRRNTRKVARAAAKAAAKAANHGR